MKLHFYGTGASEGVPAIFCRCENCMKIRKMGGRNYRSRTSCQIDDNLLIDFSADVFDHMRYGGLDMSRIDCLVVTHAHEDHFYPKELKHVMPPFAGQDGGKELTLIGSRDVCRRMREQKLEGIEAYLKIREMGNFERIDTEEFSLRALPARHDPNQECHLYILKKGGKTLLYAHDTGYFPEETWEALAGELFDGVVLDCTCCNGPSRFEGHMGFHDNLRVQKRMLEEHTADEHTVFVATHFVHTCGPFQEELEAAFGPHGFLVAYDGMEVEI